jgi:hypothetical protein
MAELRVRASYVAGLTAALFLAGSSFADDAKETVQLAYKSALRWTVRLPHETFSPVATKFAVARAGGDGFVAALEDGQLLIDTDGDGKTDASAKGKAGFAVLKGKSAAGRDFSYAVRLVNENGWKYASSGWVAAKVKGVDLRLIDQDGNGRYDDYGVDAMIVGGGESASLLSRVVNLNGVLYDLEVAPDGLEASVAPHKGPSGVLDLAKDFQSQGKLDWLIVQSKDRAVSFDLASVKDGLRVPAGEYAVTCGVISQGAETAQILAGRMQPIVVKDGGTAAPAWGGPLQMEFSYSLKDGELKIATDTRFFGRAGEEYANWKPDGGSPKFHVKDAATKEELLVAWYGSGG